MSTTTRFFALGLTVVMTACAAGPPLTYEGAIAANAERPDAVQAQEWATSVLGPFWDREFQGLLETCLEPSFQDVPSKARLIIRLDRGRVTVPLQEGVPATFPKCLSSSALSLNWPKSPFTKLYLAVEVDTTPPDPAAAAAEAQAIMDSMSRSNKSLERTREK